ncbi:hypothetical protein JNW88_20385 [Micromonospora sp. ATA32]|nr:hypothetical protein [Micromonospora sp. ATA32]
MTVGAIGLFWPPTDGAVEFCYPNAGQCSALSGAGVKARAGRAAKA